MSVWLIWAKALWDFAIALTHDGPQGPGNERGGALSTGNQGCKYAPFLSISYLP